ncbi:MULTISPECIES: glycosyltransferase [Okeania]|uniref:Glycosyltransferase family 1 protein n=1 Tax=Okeania hirsuta TaxID=1458930 RepID=A0A3N6NPS0_9CYAN|nr:MULTISPECIES: glycosyltransferase [Okeania]NES88723.1 glycosyltransferase family 4 protein [Okeania sp. SIO2B9]NET74778.1 glycosyltransferase family 4 protein [Okeania sp. SIO1F9]RQH18516.1 glycosyltransferase family 1 protein [Okeania hirsuta]RQH51407.1 glycosyltransferase family 1 protein [Okeania hirsuta]
MKIAIIASGFLPVLDGVTVSGFYRVQKLSQFGHQVLLFCPDYSPLAHLYPNWKDYTGNIFPGVQIINLPSTPFLDFERNVGFNTYKIVRQELEKFQPEIIHVDEPERLFFAFFRLAGIQFAQQHKIPCVCTFRTNFLDYFEDFLPLPKGINLMLKLIFEKSFVSIYNQYDLTLVSSSVTYEKIVNMGIKNVKYTNFHGFDVEKFQSARKTANFWESNYQIPDLTNKVKIVFLGRLTEDKGWQFTLDAFVKLQQLVNLENIAIIIVGDGPMRDEILNRLTKLTKNVYLLGRVPPENIPNILKNSDFHVTASEKETRGLTVLEAFAAGIPVIAPQAGGVVENIQDGSNGLLFTPRNQENFCEKLKLLIEDKNLQIQMGINAKESVVKYSWDNAVANLVKIWQEQITQIF